MLGVQEMQNIDVRATCGGGYGGCDDEKCDDGFGMNSDEDADD